jgi:hypothetical protein
MEATRLGRRRALSQCATSEMIDRVGGENLLLREMCGTPALIESAPVSIARDLVSIGIADRAVRSSID